MTDLTTDPSAVLQRLMERTKHDESCVSHMAMPTTETGDPDLEAFWRGEKAPCTCGLAADLEAGAALVRQIAEADELRALINNDGSLTTHEDYVGILRDAMCALANSPRIVATLQRDAERWRAVGGAGTANMRHANKRAWLEGIAVASDRHLTPTEYADALIAMEAKTNA